MELALGVPGGVVAETTGGEALEFQYAYDLEVTEARYEELIRAKTGSLIGAATEIGAGLGRGPAPGARVVFRDFGERLGTAFQIVDDLLDYLGDPEATGKPVGGDLAEGKITLPLIAALREAGEADGRRLKRLALRKRWTAGQWGQLRALIEKCGGFEYARARAAALAEDSHRLLARAVARPGRDAGAGTARRALELAVDHAVHRDR